MLDTPGRRGPQPHITNKAHDIELPRTINCDEKWADVRQLAEGSPLMTPDGISLAAPAHLGRTGTAAHIATTEVLRSVVHTALLPPSRPARPLDVMWKGLGPIEGESLCGPRLAGMRQLHALALARRRGRRTPLALVQVVMPTAPRHDRQRVARRLTPPATLLTNDVQRGVAPNLNPRR